jgi:hypothetical protein
MSITRQEKLDLKRLITEANCEDNTENIRKLKHSSKIANDIQILLRFLDNSLKQSADGINPQQFEENARNTCPFLSSNYPDIFLKIMKKELDLGIMEKFLNVLSQVEEGVFDQHEGSVYIGRILKELYLDSAIKHGNNLDKIYESEKPPVITGKPISWREYKQQHI